MKKTIILRVKLKRVYIKTSSVHVFIVKLT